METKHCVHTIFILCLYHVIVNWFQFDRRRNAAGLTPVTTVPQIHITSDVSNSRPSEAINEAAKLDASKRARMKLAQERRQREATEAHKKHGRPPLHEIITANDTIIGDPEWLLNFGILGFGKCGTSTMMVWLREHPEVQAFDRELSDFMRRRPGKLVRRFYEQLPAGPYIRGYKAPQDVSQPHILDFYREYWPKAKLIIGIRHPIRWFESLYNFRVQNLSRGNVMPHPNKLIGSCTKGKFQTCTDKGNFGFQLLKLGLQNYPQHRPMNYIEESILNRYPKAKVNFTNVKPVTNPIFIFDLDQLGDQNETRSLQFRRDVTDFIGLKEMLPSLPHRIPGKKRGDNEQERRNKMKIDICLDEYEPVRGDLMVLSRQTSLWIREVFLKHPNVVVSSPAYFLEIMKRWESDPCRRQP